MAFIPFPSDDQAIKALQKEATNATLLSTFAAQNPTFTQHPAVRKAVTSNAMQLLYKLVTIAKYPSYELVDGILVGFVEPAGQHRGQGDFSPVVYSKNTSLGTGIDRFTIGYFILPVWEKRWLTSAFEKICKYLELKGYKLFYDRGTDPRFVTEHDRESKGTFKSYVIYDQNKIKIVLNVVGQSLPYMKPQNKVQIIPSVSSVTSGSSMDRKNWTRLLHEPAAFSYAVVYPNALEHNAVVRHSLSSKQDYELSSSKSTSVQDLKYHENIQDFVPAIQFNDFLKVYKPEDIDNLEKVITFSSEVLLHGRNILPVKILSTGWNNLVKKQPDSSEQNSPEQAWAAASVENTAAIFEQLRLTLINLVCSHGITHHHVGGVDIIFYDNKMLQELIKRLEIPPYSHKAEGTEYQKADYERYAQFNWHKYAVAKFLLPPYIIECKGETILPIEAYLHHEYIIGRVGTFQKPGISLPQAKVQSELRAFISAIKTAAHFPNLTPQEIARILNLALGFNI